mmetsp:Transcript_2171/g.5172  ORF Transcript_2171/g.5172 Transcript_2171/m.5172 type:complete len:219 (-) Transcript_2171:19-675(-)
MGSHSVRSALFDPVAANGQRGWEARRGLPLVPSPPSTLRPRAATARHFFVRRRTTPFWVTGEGAAAGRRRGRAYGIVGVTKVELPSRRPSALLPLSTPDSTVSARDSRPRTPPDVGPSWTRALSYELSGRPVAERGAPLDTSIAPREPAVHPVVLRSPGETARGPSAFRRRRGLRDTLSFDCRPSSGPTAADPAAEQPHRRRGAPRRGPRGTRLHASP